MQQLKTINAEIKKPEDKKLRRMYVVRAVVFHRQDEQEVADRWGINVKTVGEWVKQFKRMV